MDIRAEFEKYLKEEKGTSSSTISAYMSDLYEFEAFIKAERDHTLSRASSSDVTAFLQRLKDDGKSAATVNRKLASVRSYYNFLISRGSMSFNPTSHIKSPRISRKDVEYLSLAEVEKLLDAPDDSEKGLRDRAILETMYATGMRSSEVAAAQVSDLNLQIGFISCNYDSKGRIIPIGRHARAAISDYLDRSRPSMLGKKEDSGALFLNYAGEGMTRQGIWKILKYYGEKTGLGSKISPQILRNSFAAHMIQNGADLKSLQELLGHEDIMATKIFLTVTKNRIMDVYDKTHPRA